MSTSDASRTTTMTQTCRSEACPGRGLKIIQEQVGHYAGDRCQVDHGWFRYRRAAAAGERLSS
jgi:hypothetical protein